MYTVAGTDNRPVAHNYIADYYYNTTRLWDRQYYCTIDIAAAVSISIRHIRMSLHCSYIFLLKGFIRRILKMSMKRVLYTTLQLVHVLDGSKLVF